MTTKARLGEDIVAALAAIQGQTPRSLTQNDDFQLPRLISAGNGRTIQVNKAIDGLITALARELKLARPELKKTVRHGEWRAWVRSATGPVLAQLDLSRPFAETGVELVTAVERAVDEELAGLPGREHAFGVTLFSEPSIPAFAIGPVTFEAASDWLTRKAREGGIPTVTARRIRKIWSGGRVRTRKLGPFL